MCIRDSSGIATKINTPRYPYFSIFPLCLSTLPISQFAKRLNSFTLLPCIQRMIFSIKNTMNGAGRHEPKSAIK